MTQLDKHVHIARRRLWMNRWFQAMSVSTAVAFLVFGVTVFIQRSFDLAIPIWIVGGGIVGAAIILAMVWAHALRPTAEAAAAEVDRAAGLRERLSSSLYCRESSDPFAQAVLHDATRIANSIRVQQHIRLQAPRAFPWTVGSLLLCSLAFLVTPGMLRTEDAVAKADDNTARTAAAVAVKKQLEPLTKFADITPEVEEFAKDLEALQNNPGGKLHRAEDIRHEAIKKIDRLEDALKEKRDSETYRAVPELKKMLRGLKIPDPSDPQMEKVTQSLAKGDFKTAKEEIEKMKEQLATLKSEEDKKFAEKMSKQLDQLAKQLEQLANDDKLQQQMEQAGVKKEDAKRMLENLTKNDLDQLQKQLEEKGLSQQQIQQMTKQIQQKQQARTLASKMAKAMQNASQGAKSGDKGQTMSGLKSAGEQLSNLEQLEQEMNEMESAMADLQDAKDNIDKPCPG